MGRLLLVGVCLVPLLVGQAGAQTVGPFPNVQSLLDRWCERNADGRSVRVAFRRFEYHDTFGVVQTFDGELVCDPTGESEIRYAPIKEGRPYDGRYREAVGGPLHWRWTPDELLVINDVRKQFDRATLPLELKPRPSLLEVLRWGPLYAFEFSRRTQVRLVPGIDPRPSLEGFRFHLSGVRSNHAVLGGIPEPGTRESEVLSEVLLILSLEPVELRAVQYRDITGKSKVVYKYDAPEVNPPPQRFDLSSYEELWTYQTSE